VRETRLHRSLRTVEGMESQVTAIVESATGTGTWTFVMAADRLHADQGRCVLVNGWQIAIFRITDSDELFALGNVDPFSGAGVISRGIIGSVGGEPKVSSPIFKQGFSLSTGMCFDDPTVSLTTYDVRERDGIIEVFA
jgi:nitrite reductase (NADH) small subunit